jgi:hypothetical protein
MRMFKASCGSQNGDRASGIYYRRTAFCLRFLWEKGLNAKDIHKEMFHIYGRKRLSCKAVHNCVEKFSQGHSKVADDAQPGHPVQTATEATMQRVEVLIRDDMRMTTESVATALGCSHGSAYS